MSELASAFRVSVASQARRSASLDDVLTRAEAARISRYHVSTIDRAIKRGDLYASHPNGRGGAVKILRRDLLKWLGLLALIVALVAGGVSSCGGAPSAVHHHHRRGLRDVQPGPRQPLRFELVVVAPATPFDLLTLASRRQLASDVVAARPGGRLELDEFRVALDENADA